MDEISKYAGKMIKLMREENGITQKQLGDLLGYSPMGVSHFESGIRNLRLDDVKKIADFFKKELSFFLPPSAQQPSVAIAGHTLFRAEATNDPATARSLSEFDNYLNTLDEQSSATH